MSERERVIEWATAREATEHHGRCNSRHDEPCDCYRRHIDYVAAHDYLALLAELEQAERERDQAQEGWDVFAARVAGAEARLAKVPALAEALSLIRDKSQNWEAETADAALADWEGEPEYRSLAELEQAEKVTEAARWYIDEYDLTETTGGGDPEHYLDKLRAALREVKK
jgi:hypothetical protein